MFRGVSVLLCEANINKFDRNKFMFKLSSKCRINDRINNNFGERRWNELVFPRATGEPSRDGMSFSQIVYKTFCVCKFVEYTVLNLMTKNLIYFM